MIVMLRTSPVFARGAIELSSVDFSPGSLISKGFASGLGSTDWVLVLDGVGHAGVICTNNCENDVPGQSFPHVVGSGIQTLSGNDALRKNGRSPYIVIAKSEYETARYIAWDEGGCPNSNWTARINFLYWDFATIKVYEPSDTSFSNPAATYEFQCVTTYTGPNSTPSTFDDGTVSCTQMYPAK
jgi:hypothetical protein